MRISLLHPGEIPAPAVPTRDDLLYHLSLDRSLARLCPDSRSRGELLSVITRITADPAEITYRQQIMSDLLRIPALADDLANSFSRFSELLKAQKDADRQSRSTGASRTATVTGAKNFLQTQAVCCQRTLLSVKELAERLDHRPLTAEGLIAIRDRCRAMAEDPAHARLLHLCRKYSEFSERELLAYRFTLTPDGHIEGYALTDRRHLPADPQKKKGLALLAKPPAQPGVPLAPTDREGYDTFTASAFTTLAAKFAAVTCGILQDLVPLARELDFYTAALAYAASVREKGATLCFPAITPNTPTAAEGLYDLLLLSEAITCEKVVPHSFTLPARGGLMVLGENGSGKTVFLRAAATLQILAQAGLPVPCTAANLNPCTALALQFSHSEEREDNSAGRFEQEVRELADMVDGLQAGATVFLNETFQSTAYTEGAEGLCPILRHFGACGIRWVLVSHLKDLPAMLSPEEAEVRRTGKGYRIIPQ